MDKATFTYQARITATAEVDAALAGYAGLYTRVERKLHAAIEAGSNPVKLKSSFLKDYGVTARQFNAVAIGLKGKLASIKERRPGLIAELTTKIQKAKAVIGKLEKRCPGSNKLHQKKRRLAILETRLARLNADKAAEATRLCFGSRRLFRAQYDLEANGYANHGEWLKAWQTERANQFMVIGSKDETAGCQGCVATLQAEGSFSLRLRLPEALITGGKYITLHGLKFHHGRDVVEKALLLTSNP